MRNKRTVTINESSLDADTQIAADLLALGDWMQRDGQVHNAATVLAGCDLIYRLWLALDAHPNSD